MEKFFNKKSNNFYRRGIIMSNSYIIGANCRNKFDKNSVTTAFNEGLRQQCTYHEALFVPKLSLAESLQRVFEPNNELNIVTMRSLDTYADLYFAPKYSDKTLCISFFDFRCPWEKRYWNNFYNDNARYLRLLLALSKHFDLHEIQIKDDYECLKEETIPYGIRIATDINSQQKNNRERIVRIIQNALENNFELYNNDSSTLFIMDATFTQLTQEFILTNKLSFLIKDNTKKATVIIENERFTCIPLQDDFHTPIKKTQELAVHEWIELVLKLVENFPILGLRMYFDDINPNDNW